MANLFEQYKQQSLTTMSSGDLLVAMYDGILKNMRIMAMLLDNKDYDNAQVPMKKADALLDELVASLDFKNSDDSVKANICAPLMQYYLFFKRQLVAANIRRKSDALNEIIPVITDLRNTWAQASKSIHVSAAAGTMKAQPPTAQQRGIGV